MSIDQSRNIMKSFALTIPIVACISLVTSNCSRDRAQEEIVPQTNENLESRVIYFQPDEPEYPLEIITEDYVDDIIQIESSGIPTKVSRKGARGLMQIMPATWKDETRKLYGKEFDFDKAFDPEINVEVGKAYLSTIENYLSTRIEGWNELDVQDRRYLIAAAYNGGMGRLVRNEGDISRMPLETRNYVKRLEDLSEN